MLNAEPRLLTRESFQVNFAANLIFDEHAKLMTAHYIQTLFYFHTSPTEGYKQEANSVLYQLQGMAAYRDQTFNHYIKMLACFKEIIVEKNDKLSHDLLTLLFFIIEDLKYLDPEFMLVVVFCLDCILFQRKQDDKYDDCLRLFQSLTKNNRIFLENLREDNSDLNKGCLKFVCLGFDTALKIRNADHKAALQNLELFCGFRELLKVPRIIANTSFFKSVLQSIEFLFDLHSIIGVGKFDSDSKKDPNLPSISSESNSFIDSQAELTAFIKADSQAINKRFEELTTTSDLWRFFFKVKKFVLARAVKTMPEASAGKLQKELIRHKSKKTLFYFLDLNYKSAIRKSSEVIVQHLVMSFKIDKRSKNLDLRMVKILATSLFSVKCVFEFAIVMQCFDLAELIPDYRDLFSRFPTQLNPDLISFVFDIDLLGDLIAHNFDVPQSKIVHDLLVERINSADVLSARTVSGSKQVELIKLYDFVLYLGQSDFLNAVEFT